MAYIRIPTGIQTVTATVSRKSYIQYQCCKCGKTVLHEYKLFQQGSGIYHVFQSEATQQKVENNAGAKATQQLDQQDAALFNAINVEHNYECVTQKIECPHCSEKQPWSKFPRPWKKTKLFGLWIVGLVGFSIESIAMFTFVPEIGANFAVLTAFLALLPCFRSIRRKKARRNIQSATFAPPIYYNRQNIQELIEQLNLNCNQEGVVNTSSGVPGSSTSQNTSYNQPTGASQETTVLGSNAPQQLITCSKCGGQYGMLQWQKCRCPYCGNIEGE